jgi:phosphocarrier protein HPr
MPNRVARATVEVRNGSGLHLRPAALISKAAISFRSKISIIRGKQVANARSIVGLTTLGASLGTGLTIEAEGPDAESAVRAIAALFDGGFGED